MLKCLTRKLFILSALIAYLTLAVPSTPAQGSGCSLSGKVHHYFYDVLDSPPVYIYKWNGSTWAFHGVAYADSCGDYTYDTGGPGEFIAQQLFEQTIDTKLRLLNGFAQKTTGTQSPAAF